MIGSIVKVKDNIYRHEFFIGEEVLIIQKLCDEYVVNEIEMWLCKSSTEETWYLTEDEFEIL